MRICSMYRIVYLHVVKCLLQKYDIHIQPYKFIYIHITYKIIICINCIWNDYWKHNGIGNVLNIALNRI